MKKLIIKNILISLILSVSIYLLYRSGLVIFFNSKQQSYNPDEIDKYIEGIYKTTDLINNMNLNRNNNTTGVISEIILSGSTLITGNTIIPDDIRGFIDYIQINGIAGKDYIIAYPMIPPIIRSSEKSTNNDIIYKYLFANRNIFTIPKTEKEGYIMFVLSEEIAENRDFFLSIDGKVTGHIKKQNSLAVYKKTEYLYKMSQIPLIEGFNINLYKSILSNKLSVNAFVGQQGNYVEKIIIVFK